MAAMEGRQDPADSDYYRRPPHQHHQKARRKSNAIKIGRESLPDSPSTQQEIKNRSQDNDDCKKRGGNTTKIKTSHTQKLSLQSIMKELKGEKEEEEEKRNNKESKEFRDYINDGGAMQSVFNGNLQLSIKSCSTTYWRPCGGISTSGLYTHTL
jgi:hypothetical protein